MSAGCSPTLPGCWRSSSASPPAPIRKTQHARAAERQVRARLDRLARAEQRLVDAYQAEAISLAELARATPLVGRAARTASSGSMAAARSYAGEQVKAGRC